MGALGKLRRSLSKKASNRRNKNGATVVRAKDVMVGGSKDVPLLESAADFAVEEGARKNFGATSASSSATGGEISIRQKSLDDDECLASKDLEGEFYTMEAYAPAMVEWRKGLRLGEGIAYLWIELQMSRCLPDCLTR